MRSQSLDANHKVVKPSIRAAKSKAEAISKLCVIQDSKAPFAHTKFVSAQSAYNAQTSIESPFQLTNTML